MIMIRTITVIPWDNCSQFWAYPAEDNAGKSDKPAHSMAVAGAEPELNSRRCVLLLSRLPKRSCAEEEWLQFVREAVDWAGKQNYTIVSSVGMMGWEYVTWYAANRGIPIWIVLPPDRLSGTLGNIESIISRLELDETRASCLQPLSEGNLPKAYIMHLRDRVTFNLAHERMPIALRKGSSWNRLTQNAVGVNRQFETKYPVRSKPGWVNLKEGCSNPLEDTGVEYLIHWTRGVYGPWPGESHADYFRELTNTNTGNPRDGYNTLNQIVMSGVIRGEGRMIREGEPTISFTASAPAETMKRLSYRAALGHWNYEPYGIAIPKSLLADIGAKPVIYGDNDRFEELNVEEKPYFQFSGRNTSQTGQNDTPPEKNWVTENEWRLIGDFDFSSISEHIFLLLPNRSEAEQMGHETGYKALALSGK